MLLSALKDVEPPLSHARPAQERPAYQQPASATPSAPGTPKKGVAAGSATSPFFHAAQRTPSHTKLASPPLPPVPTAVHLRQAPGIHHAASVRRCVCWRHITC